MLGIDKDNYMSDDDGKILAEPFTFLYSFREYFLFSLSYHHVEFFV